MDRTEENIRRIHAFYDEMAFGSKDLTEALEAIIKLSSLVTDGIDQYGNNHGKDGRFTKKGSSNARSDLPKNKKDRVKKKGTEKKNITYTDSKDQKVIDSVLNLINSLPKPTKQELQERFGPKLGAYRGTQAITKMLKRKTGYIPKAFRRDDIGNIALCWGNKKGGLEHIYEKHVKDMPANLQKEFWIKMSKTIANGHLQYDKAGKFMITDENRKIIISPEFCKKGFIWTITAFGSYK